jgi:hypothetical protein
VTVSSHAPVWNPASYEIQEVAGGWTIYPLEEESYPWGLAFQGGSLWAVDNGRGVLVRAAIAASVTACSLADQDGNLDTQADRSPLPGQTVYLWVDGARQDPGQTTQADGCYTWDDLPAEHIYGLELVASSGWELLTSAQVDFGLAQPGDVFSYDFILAASESAVYLPLLVR